MQVYLLANGEHVAVGAFRFKKLLVLGVVGDSRVEPVAHGEERGADCHRDVVSWIQTSATVQVAVSPGRHERRRRAFDDSLRQTGRYEAPDDGTGQSAMQSHRGAVATERNTASVGVVAVQLEVRPIVEQSPGGTGRRERGTHGCSPVDDDRSPASKPHRVDGTMSPGQLRQGSVWVAAEHWQVPEQRAAGQRN